MNVIIAPSEIVNETICYIGGCGRLGIALAAWTAHRGYDVICADVNESAVRAVNSGKFITLEPEVPLLVAAHGGRRLVATADTVGAVLQSSMSFIIVPTPSKPDGSFSLEYVLRACESIGEGLRGHDDYHVVVVVSTVMPGHTRGPIRYTLEEVSGKEAGNDFGLVFSPEFIRQGNIVHDFSHPAQILIGEFDTRSGDTVKAHYLSIVENIPIVRRMSLVSAEIAKIGLNSAVVTKLAVANQLAWLCHCYPSADARDVLESVGSDPRIGSGYFGAGAPDGGSCFPRDSRALSAAAHRVNTSTPIALSVDRFRNTQHEWIFRVACDLCPDSGIVGIAGLTFKPGIDITEESAGTILRDQLRNSCYLSVVYDSIMAQGSGFVAFVEAADVIIVTIPDAKFKQLEKLGEEGLLKNKAVFDLWGFLDESKLNCREYIRLGEGK